MWRIADVHVNADHRSRSTIHFDRFSPLPTHVHLSSETLHVSEQDVQMMLCIRRRNGTGGRKETHSQGHSDPTRAYSASILKGETGLTSTRDYCGIFLLVQLLSNIIAAFRLCWIILRCRATAGSFSKLPFPTDLYVHFTKRRQVAR